MLKIKNRFTLGIYDTWDDFSLDKAKNGLRYPNKKWLLIKMKTYSYSTMHLSMILPTQRARWTETYLGKLKTPS